jgi:hypothetical protein
MCQMTAQVIWARQPDRVDALVWALTDDCRAVESARATSAGCRHRFVRADKEGTAFPRHSSTFGQTAFPSETKASTRLGGRWMVPTTAVTGPAWTSAMASVREVFDNLSSYGFSKHPQCCIQPRSARCPAVLQPFPVELPSDKRHPDRDAPKQPTKAFEMVFDFLKRAQVADMPEKPRPRGAWWQANWAVAWRPRDAVSFPRPAFRATRFRAVKLISEAAAARADPARCGAAMTSTPCWT